MDAWWCDGEPFEFQSSSFYSLMCKYPTERYGWIPGQNGGGGDVALLATSRKETKLWIKEKTK